MRRMSYFLKCFFVSLLSAYLVCIQQQAFAQITMYDNSTLANGGTLINLNTGPLTNYQNQTVTTAGYVDSGITLPNCPSTAPATGTDAWVKVQANANGYLIFTYSPLRSAGLDVALIVYREPTSPTGPVNTNARAIANFLNCANVYGAGFSETVTISATANSIYYFRIVNVGSASQINGKLSIYSGLRSVGDLCTDANAIGIGTCNYPFDIQPGFLHDEDLTGTPSCGTITPGQYNDGWLKIDVPANRSVRLQYNITNSKNASMTVYTGNCGGTLAEITTEGTPCVTSTGGAPLITSITNSTAGTVTYNIRIANLSDNNAMTGNICATEILVRDDCATAFAAASSGATIKPGDCNLKVDILNSFGATPAFNGAAVCSESLIAKDGWVIYQAPASGLPGSLVFEYASTNGGIPSVIIYDAGVGGSALTLPCGGAGPNQASSISLGAGACQSPQSGATSVAAQFTPVANHVYFIRVVREATSANPDMLGFACFYDNTLKAEDNFYSSQTFSNTGADCGRQFNILSTFNANGALNNNTGIDNINCPTNTNLTNDAWANFITPATLPTNGYAITYNNTNSDPTVANNVLMAVYRGPANPVAAGPVPNPACATATVMAVNTASNITVGNTLDANPVSGVVTSAVNPAGDAWVQVTSANPFTITFTNTTGDASIEVYTGTCGALVPDAGVATNNTVQPANPGENALGTEVFIVPAGGTYYVRIINNADVDSPLSMAGTLTVYSLTQIACVDAVGEGIEQITLTSATAGFVANTKYFIRIANVGSTSGTTPGTICIRQNDLVDGDLCNNSQSIMVGACDFSFDIEASEFLNTQIVGTAVAPCSAPQRDGWLSFTATSNQTTFEYLNESPTQNAALAVYRGSCTSLIAVPVNSSIYCTTVASGGTNTAKMKFNTVAGLQYFIQIINTTSTGTDLLGRGCLYNTTERDVCDDNDLATLQVGQCNIAFDVPITFDQSSAIAPQYRNIGDADNQVPPYSATLPLTELGGSTAQTVASTCETEANFTATDTNNPILSTAISAKDAWIRLIGNGSPATISYQNKQASNPSIVVYTALQSVGPVNCGLGLSGAGYSKNQYACTNRFNTNAIQTEAVTFQTNSGQLYLVRIIDLAGVGMTGTLCVSDGGHTYDSPCVTNGVNDPRKVDIGKCNVALNVIQGVSLCADPQVGINGQPYGSNTSVAACTGCVNGTSGGSGDTWAYFTIPPSCDPVAAAAVASPSVANCAAASANYYYDASTNKCRCNANTIAPTTPSTVTIQYDNRNGTFDLAADMKLAVYSIPGGTPLNNANCSLENQYTLVGCADALTGASAEGVESVSFPVTISSSAPNRTYLIRIINKDNAKTLYGSLCTFYGNTVGIQACAIPMLNDYGSDLDGEFRNIDVTGGSNVKTALVNPPSDVIPNCVIAGGSNPTTNSSYPIRADAWMSFGVPAINPPQAVTIQYDNTGITPQQNAAIAVYRIPVDPTGVLGTGNCNAWVNGGSKSLDAPSGAPNNPNGMELMDCANTVFVGSESITINVQAGFRYYVRVMNIQNTNTPPVMSGRIRVFPYAQCNLSPTSLVTDGNFGMWPAIASGADGLYADNTINTAAVYDTRQSDDRYRVQDVTNTSAYPNNLDGVAPINGAGVARFATVFGYARDRTGSGVLPAGGIDNTTATYSQLSGNRGELSDEGQYVVKQTPWLLKDDWFCYGNNYSGYGGRTGGGLPQQSYCATGAGGAGREPCVSINQGTQYGGLGFTNGTYNPSNGITVVGSIDRPRRVPNTADANFMIVNGSYDPNNPSIPPGKIWCQTVQRTSGSVGYYVFSVWGQNMISTGRNLDVPMLRLTVCDMEDASGNFPTTTNPAITARSSKLPGITDGQLTPVIHQPAPQANRIASFNTIPNYGAAMTCNQTWNGVNEARDARLKVLGSQFLLTESPDQWVLLRCIYRAPADVAEMNICVENLSLTKNGNDLGVDDIDFRECLSADATTFDRLLKGDPCELTDNPSGLPLGPQYLDFSGKLVGDKVLLNWITLVEKDVFQYEVQRSIDGTHFVGIGKLDAKGTAKGMAEYNFADRDIPFGVNTIYYRLNAIELGGYSKIGPMISVEVTSLETFDMKLVPNPVVAGDDVELRFNVPIGQAGISVSDMVGTRLMSKVIPTTNGDNKVFLNTKGMKSGVYIVRLIHNGKSVAKKLVIL